MEARAVSLGEESLVRRSNSTCSQSSSGKHKRRWDDAHSSPQRSNEEVRIPSRRDAGKRARYYDDDPPASSSSRPTQSEQPAPEKGVCLETRRLGDAQVPLLRRNQVSWRQ